jgi:hypothetical protein
MDHYDLVIIGGGPSGLALAQCISHLNKKILIIEKEHFIGGCHAVKRVKYGSEFLFSEHGPRIYSDTYTVFIDLLKEMNVDFYDLFTKYNFTISKIGGDTIFSTLSFYELSFLFFEFVKLLFNNEYGDNTILKDFLSSSNFNIKSIDLINRICKLTDGGGIDKYTLNKFLQLLNQQFFYYIYQPKKPNDIGLFKIWQEFLNKRNVEFSLGSIIHNIQIRNNKIESLDIITNSQLHRITSNNFVFAIPPKNLYEIIEKFNIPHSWGDLKTFAIDTAYIEYISVSFHWDNKLKLPKVYGFPKTAWGVGFIVLSDYMTFDESTSKTVISTAITITDEKSLNNGKTANECNYNQLINELFLQLKESFPNLPDPTKIVLSPEVHYNTVLQKWQSDNTAFISTSNKGNLPFHNNIIDNMYNLGTHNGKSYYKFTSLESAVSNAVVLSKELYPSLKGNNFIKLSSGFTVSQSVRILLLGLIIYLIYYFIIKKHGKSRNR